jgi:hypothetical protein
MIVGAPREIKNHEYRVGLTPAGTHTLVAAGHEVLIERDAGTRVGFPDSAYAAAGATVVDCAAEVYARADLIVKVKELQAEEYALARAGQILFCYHHFAPNPRLAAAMIERGTSCLAYETVTDVGGGLPLLKKAWCTTAWAICPAPAPVLPRSPSPMPARPMPHDSPISACATRCCATPACARAYRSTAGRLHTPASPRNCNSLLSRLRKHWNAELAVHSPLISR